LLDDLRRRFAEKVGLRVHTTSAAPYRSQNLFQPVKKKLPPGLLISSRPIFLPAKLASRAGGVAAFGTLSFPG
jgi:hypothetical protein